ncbi:MAG: ATP-dependent 6-phosphofructokinase [Pirellulaceae bacterium]
MSRSIGILTSGGDCPGLNAAIRGVGKAGIEVHGMTIIGFRDGFRGLMQDRHVTLDSDSLSNILTQGGTILGTSRDKPHRMLVGNKVLDMTDVMVEVYHKHHLEALVCLGGGGTQKNAMRLAEKGLKIVTLPKTIDNDVAETDVTFGFDTALAIATDAVDRLHSTATSHNRIIVVEIMGHRAGWLALGAGLAGGADAILIPEIPYDVERIAESIRARTRRGKRFSIVAVAEGALSQENAMLFAQLRKQKDEAKTKKEKDDIREQLVALDQSHDGNTLRLTRDLEQRTGLESRLTILGHLQRGGTPSASDRLLATILGTGACELISQGKSGFMMAIQGQKAVPVPLEKVSGAKKLVPIDHPWVRAARQLGVCLGD